MPEFAKITPVTPPTVNRKINPIAKSIGVFNEIEPPHIVAIQLKILIPVGTAIIGIVTSAQAAFLLPPNQAGQFLSTWLSGTKRQHIVELVLDYCHCHHHHILILISNQPMALFM